jgi:hypothetical protein
MLVKQVSVTNPEMCPFRYRDEEWDIGTCALCGSTCDEKRSVRTETHREIIAGLTRVDYIEQEVCDFPAECPFGGKPFTVSVEQT